MLDLYRNVQAGKIPVGHYVYVLQRSPEIGKGVTTLRWANVEPARDGEPGGELNWSAPNPSITDLIRPLSKSIYFVVTPQAVSDPALLFRARHEPRVSNEVALPDYVTLACSEQAPSENGTKETSLRLRKRSKVEVSAEFETLLDLVVLGRHDKGRHSGTGRFRPAQKQAKQSPIVSVAKLKIETRDDATSTGARSASLARDIMRRNAISGNELAQRQRFASMYADSTNLPEAEIKNAADVMMALRLCIRDCLGNDSQRDNDTHAPSLKALLPEPIYDEYRHLKREMIAMARVSKAHPKREYVDVYNDDGDEALAKGIDRWIDQLCDWLNESRKLLASGEPNERNDSDALSADMRVQIEALVWLHFVVHSEELNEASLLKDIDEFDDGKTRMKGEVYGHLAQYRLARSQLKKLLEGHDLDLIEYSPRTLWRVMKVIAKLGNLREQRLNLIALVATFITQGIVRGIAPLIYAGVLEGGRFNLSVYSEYWATYYLGNDLLGSYGPARVEKSMQRMDGYIQRRWMQKAFYGDEERVSFDKRFNALTRGREASSKLITDSLNIGAPGLVQLTAAAAVLSGFDPRLGVTGLISLPMMYLWAKHHNSKMERLYRESNQEIDRTSENNRRYLDGEQDLRMLTTMSAALDDVAQQFDKERSLARYVSYRKAWQWFWSYLPMNLGMLGTVTVGLELGLPAGEILASTMAFGNLTYPIQRLSNKYFDEFPRHVLDIIELRDRVGSLDAIDPPSGPLEHTRLPVSALSNLEIAFRDVGFSAVDAAGNNKTVLEPSVSLTIAPGEFVTLLGPSGSGKTTLMKMLGGILVPSAGEIALGGTPLGEIKHYGDDSLLFLMHYASQHSSFFPGTLFHNLLMDMPRSTDRDELIRRENEMVALMEKLGLSADKFDLHAEFPKSLSGGEKVRFSLIRAALPIVMASDAQRSGILMMDEPTAGLDPERTRMVVQFLRELNARGVTILCITHNDELAAVGRQIHMSSFK
ncbi:ATP-binding cassette domain-containing protein [Trinickia sp. LjRoot230]|uniref:ATP-binding cassette domain-containing protein n=1 Tax=Trinickia sp. LjRoot230 TaxID=3342288 RepID=UPI003ECD0557